jgi:hypothetical protein
MVEPIRHGPLGLRLSAPNDIHGVRGNNLPETEINRHRISRSGLVTQHEEGGSQRRLGARVLEGRLGARVVGAARAEELLPVRLAHYFAAGRPRGCEGKKPDHGSDDGDADEDPA